jgi:Homeodomain
MSIFDLQDNIFKYEEKYPKYEYPYFQHDFIFFDNKSECQSPVLSNIVKKVAVEQESVKNMRLAWVNSLSAKSETTNDEFAPTVVPFVHGAPDIKQLELIVNSEINEKGYNATVLDCLDISFEDNIEEESGDIIRKKQKKSRSQIKALKAEFSRNPNWTKKWIKRIAKELGLTTYQVYKWHWDTSNKKNKMDTESVSSNKRMKTFE